MISERRHGTRPLFNKHFYIYWQKYHLMNANIVKTSKGAKTIWRFISFSKWYWYWCQCKHYQKTDEEKRDGESRNEHSELNGNQLSNRNEHDCFEFTDNEIRLKWVKSYSTDQNNWKRSFMCKIPNASMDAVWILQFQYSLSFISVLSQSLTLHRPFHLNTSFYFQIKERKR